MNIYELRIKHLPKCTYCNEPATTRDHVPPRCLLPFNEKTVPACRRCNSGILRDLPLPTVELRKTYVAGFLAANGQNWRLRQFG